MTEPVQPGPPGPTLPSEIWLQVFKHLKRPLPKIGDKTATWKDVQQQERRPLARLGQRPRRLQGKSHQIIGMYAVN